jgi:hypothetical protein
MPPATEESPAAKALGTIDDYTKLLITLATGVLTLSATFLGGFYRGHDFHQLRVGWVLLGISIVAGIFARGSYISQLAQDKLKPRKSLLEACSIGQWTTLVAGGIFFGVAVIANVSAAPTIIPLGMTTTVSPAGTAKVPFACRTGDTNGCAVQLQAFGATSPRYGGPVTVVEVPSDSNQNAIVTLPADLQMTLRSRKSATGQVVVKASSRIGGTSTTALTLHFLPPITKHGSAHGKAGGSARKRRG